MKSIGIKIERMLNGIGRIGSFLILFIMTFIAYEVVARYVFNAPTSWVWPVSKQIFGVFVMIAGSYAMIHNQHIRIEVFYDRYPPLLKSVIRGLSLLIAILFLGSLLWKGTIMGLDAWHTKEKAVGMLKLPLYPLKLFIPIGTALFILGCVAYFSRSETSKPPA